MIPMRVPGIIRRTRPAAVRPILVLATPINRDDTRPRFDESAGQKDRLAVAVAAIGIAYSAGFQTEIEGTPHVRPGQQSQRLVLKAVEIAHLALQLECSMATMNLMQQRGATRKSLARNV